MPTRDEWTLLIRLHSHLMRNQSLWVPGGVWSQGWNLKELTEGHHQEWSLRLNLTQHGKTYQVNKRRLQLSGLGIDTIKSRYLVSYIYLFWGYTPGCGNHLLGHHYYFYDEELWIIVKEPRLIAGRSKKVMDRVNPQASSYSALILTSRHNDCKGVGQFTQIMCSGLRYSLNIMETWWVVCQT